MELYPLPGNIQPEMKCLRGPGRRHYLLAPMVKMTPLSSTIGQKFIPQETMGEGIMRVGFIGLGNVGGKLAGSLVRN